MAKYTGKSMIVVIGTTTLTSNLVRTVTTTEAIDTSESSGAGDTDKTYLATLRDTDVALDLLDDSSTANLWTLVEPTGGTNQQGTTLTIYPLGTTTGLPKLSTTTFIIQHRARAENYTAVVPVTVSGKVSGGLTEGTAP